MTQLFTHQTTDATSAPFRHAGNGQALNLYVSGNFGGGRVILEAQTPDGSTWEPVQGGELYAPGLHVLQAAPLIGRLRLLDATGADLSAWAEPDDNATYWRVQRAQ